MTKALIVVLFSFAIVNCTAPLVIKRKVRVNNTDKGFTIKLTKHKHRVDRNDKIVIAVIDTGFDSKYEKDVKLCKTGHKSFVTGDESIKDDHGHGTHIAGLIAQNIKVDYCVIIIKYYSPKAVAQDNLVNTIKSFKHAIDQNVDMINYSGGGINPDKREKLVIEKALDKDIIIVAAAGNEGLDFKDQTYYPAMYDKRIIVVGNLYTNDEDTVERHPTSNYGDEVDIQVFGTDIKSVNGKKMTGTSQSTAIVTGRLAKYTKQYRSNKSCSPDSLPLYKYMR